MAEAAAAQAGDAQSQWNDLVAAEKSKGISNQQAVMNVNRRNPGLRERMLDEVNAGRRGRR